MITQITIKAIVTQKAWLATSDCQSVFSLTPSTDSMATELCGVAGGVLRVASVMASSRGMDSAGDEARDLLRRARRDALVGDLAAAAHHHHAVAHLENVRHAVR